MTAKTSSSDNLGGAARPALNRYYHEKEIQGQI